MINVAAKMFTYQLSDDLTGAVLKILPSPPNMDWYGHQGLGEPQGELSGC